MSCSLVPLVAGLALGCTLGIGCGGLAPLPHARAARDLSCPEEDLHFEYEKRAGTDPAGRAAEDGHVAVGDLLRVTGCGTAGYYRRDPQQWTDVSPDPP
jgi:hypothetical protein